MVARDTRRMYREIVRIVNPENLDALLSSIFIHLHGPKRAAQLTMKRPMASSEPCGNGAN